MGLPSFNKEVKEERRVRVPGDVGLTVRRWPGEGDGLRRNVNRFRGGLVCKARRLVYHSTLGLRVIKKKKVTGDVGLTFRRLPGEGDNFIDTELFLYGKKVNDFCVLRPKRDFYGRYISFRVTW